MLKILLYNMNGDPVAHMRGYCTKMRGVGGKNDLFQSKLEWVTSEEYTHQDASKWYTEWNVSSLSDM